MQSTRAAGLIGPAERHASTSRPRSSGTNGNAMQVGAATRHRRGHDRDPEAALGQVGQRQRGAGLERDPRCRPRLRRTRASNWCRMPVPTGSAISGAVAQVGQRDRLPLASGSAGHTAASIASSVTTSTASPSGTSSGPTEAIARSSRPVRDVLDQVVGIVCAEGDLDVGMLGVKVGQQPRHVDVVRRHRADVTVPRTSCGELVDGDVR